MFFIRDVERQGVEPCGVFLQGSLGPRSPPRVLSVGVEPTRPKAPGLESGAYASFATRASAPRTGVEPVISWLRTRRPANRPTRHRTVDGNRTRAARSENPDWPPAATTAQRSVRDSNPWSPARQAGVHSNWTDRAWRMPVESNHTPLQTWCNPDSSRAPGHPGIVIHERRQRDSNPRAAHHRQPFSRRCPRPAGLPPGVPRQGIEPCSPD